MQNHFEWQEGYGSFFIGATQASAAIAYIAHQQQHHLKRDFQAELLLFLKKNRMEYDPRYIWG
jgi:putative transposase